MNARLSAIRSAGTLASVVAGLCGPDEPGPRLRGQAYWYLDGRNVPESMNNQGLTRYEPDLHGNPAPTPRRWRCARSRTRTDPIAADARHLRVTYWRTFDTDSEAEVVVGRVQAVPMRDPDLDAARSLLLKPAKTTFPDLIGSTGGARGGRDVVGPVVGMPPWLIQDDLVATGHEATTTAGRMMATVRAAAMARMDLRIDDQGQAAALPGLLSSWSPSQARGNELIAVGRARVPPDSVMPRRGLRG